VTGASGAGKTALVKEIGKRMSEDERALTRVSSSRFQYGVSSNH